MFPFALPSLETLAFYGYYDGVYSFTGDRGIENLRNLGRYETVRKVVFDTCYLGPVITRAFAYAIPNLQEYTLNDIRILKTSSSSEVSEVETVERELDLLLTTSRPELTSFTCFAGSHIRWDEKLQRLIDIESFKSLKNLSIMIEEGERSPFGELLNVVGPSLEHLSLEIVPGPGSGYRDTFTHGMLSFSCLYVVTNFQRVFTYRLPRVYRPLPAPEPQNLLHPSFHRSYTSA